MTQGLRIVTFGGLNLTLDSAPVTGLASRKAEALLVYLACTRRPHARDVLADLLWDDVAAERARGNLSVLLTSLRHQLAPYLAIDRHSVSLSAAPPVWLDAAEVESALSGVTAASAPALAPAALDRIHAALRLYHGDFLHGFALRDSAGFDAWMRDEQERLRRLVVGGAHALMTAHLARRAYSAALAEAQQLLRLDPLQEEVHRQVMRLYVYTGQRSAALSQYATCRRILAEELDVEPAAETTAVYAQILAGELALPEGPPIAVRPAPGALPAVRGLPFQATPFIGRDAERADIAARLADPECRLLTLLGPGGIGKTRLAMQVAAEHAPSLVDGAAFVALEAVAELQHVATAIARVLNIATSGTADPAAEVRAFLRSKQLLLVLDNVEHLPDSAELVNDLLMHAPQTKIMVTSRERLYLRAEWLLDVGGLSYPTDRELAPETALTYSAVQLFTQQAARVHPQFRLTATEVSSVLRICQLAEGMPLAIELAAAATRQHSGAEIASAVAHTLDLLTTQLRDVPARHRSVRAVWAYSWDLLAPPQRALLCRLALFRGGCSPKAAAEIIDGTRAAMAELVDRSLVRRGADGRYVMHEMVRQFAAERWQAETDAEQRAAAAAAHSRWYLELVAAREASLAGRDSVTALRELWLDFENIRSAWSDAVTHARTFQLGRTAASLARWYDLAGLFTEGASAFRAAATAVADAGTEPRAAETDAVVGALLMQQARFLCRSAQYDTAVQVAEEAAARATAVGDHHTEAHALQLWGETLWHQARYPEAQVHLEQALRRARSAGIVEVEAEALLNLGVVAESMGDYRAMQDLQAQALALYEQLGDLRGMGLALNNLAGVAYHLGAYAAAIGYLEQALAVCQRADDRYNESRVYNNLGDILAFQGAFGRAQAYLEQALQIKRELGDRRGESVTLSNLGDIARQCGDYAAARAAIEEGLQIMREIGYRLGEAHVLAELALVCHQIDAQPEARHFAGQALTLAEELGAPAIQASALTYLGHVLLAVQQPVDAAAAYERALAVRRTLDQPAQEMEVRAGLARVALAQGQPASALAHVDAILDYLEHGTLQGTTEPFRIVLTCQTVLAARNDPRERALVRDAHHTLHEQAASLPTAAARTSFLGVATHRAIVALARANRGAR